MPRARVVRREGGVEAQHVVDEEPAALVRPSWLGLGLRLGFGLGMGLGIGLGLELGLGLGLGSTLWLGAVGYPRGRCPRRR